MRSRAVPFDWAAEQPLVMGILNVTPDSFSDGGRHEAASAAIEAGLRMIADGAGIVDIGGESTRPGAAPTDPSVEQDRVLPVIEALAGHAVLSIDTRNAATMRHAVNAGAVIVNDVSGLSHDPQATSTVAALGCAVVLMHMRGTPQTMSRLTAYGDVVEDVRAALAMRVREAERGGIARHRIAIDPGIGFAKTGAQNLELLQGLGALAALGLPILVGLSRKGFIGVYGGEQDAALRGPGSIAAGLFAVSQGAKVLRVHDVRETVQALKIWQALTTGTV